MNEPDTQVYALTCYETALMLFRSRQYAKAQQKIREYRQWVDYGSVKYHDNRGAEPGRATVIIVTRNRGFDLLACLESLKIQDGPLFEIIVVENGSDHSMADRLRKERLLLVECPIAFTPSEGRNIGVFHARTELFIFLDDDALAEPCFVRSAIQAFDVYPFLGIRGRILPKTFGADNRLAGLYDMGCYPLPALLDIEGNMAVPAALYHTVGGMNPLLFGAEGLDLTVRLLETRPEGEVYYWPGMAIRHDYACGDRLVAKRERQALVNDYFRVMQPGVLTVKKRYAGLYRACRKQDRGPLLKRFSRKMCTIGKEMELALQGEKALVAKSPPPDEATLLPMQQDDPPIAILSAMEGTRLLKRIHLLETEIEKMRNLTSFKFWLLIKEAWASPLRQGTLLPIRLGRLIKGALSRK